MIVPCNHPNTGQTPLEQLFHKSPLVEFMFSKHNGNPKNSSLAILLDTSGHQHRCIQNNPIVTTFTPECIGLIEWRHSNWTLTQGLKYQFNFLHHTANLHRRNLKGTERFKNILYSAGCNTLNGHLSHVNTKSLFGRHRRIARCRLEGLITSIHPRDGHFNCAKTSLKRAIFEAIGIAVTNIRPLMRLSTAVMLILKQHRSVENLGKQMASRVLSTGKYEEKSLIGSGVRLVRCRLISLRWVISLTFFLCNR